MMPNPKTGTVTFDIGAAVKEIKAGKVEFRVDKTAIIHVPVGKLSFEDSHLVENTEALFQAVVRAKPVGLPLRFEAAKVSRLQILHSRFADDGESNPGFRAGPLRLQVLSIEAIR